MSGEGPARKALVTGASSGIGEALAGRLARDGWSVWIAARRRDKLEEVAARLRQSGARVEIVELDVSDADATAAKVVELDEACGGFDLVVANAGAHGTSRPKRLTWELARSALQTNLLGGAATLVPLVPRMIARRRGHLVGVASIAADFPVPMMAVYGSSKAGLSHLLQALRPNLRRYNVFATVAHPGFVKTPFLDGATIRLPGLMELEPAVEIIYRGIRKKKAVIRFPLHVRAAIGLFNVLPRPLRDWVIRRLRL